MARTMMASNGVFGLIHVLLDFSGTHKVLTFFIVLESGKFMYFTEVLPLIISIHSKGKKVSK